MIIDELIEKAFCEGYEYALEEREFNSKASKLINNTLNLKQAGSRSPKIDAYLISRNLAGKGSKATLSLGRLINQEKNDHLLERANLKDITNNFSVDRKVNNKLFQNLLKEEIKKKEK